MTFNRKKWYEEYKVKHPGYHEDWRQKRRALGLQAKARVLAHYSGADPAICVSCGFSDLRALTIDHVNGNGAEERKAMGRKLFGGAELYLWLERNNLPKGYQVLCMNCQFIKRVENHEFRRKKGARPR